MALAGIADGVAAVSIDASAWRGPVLVGVALVGAAPMTCVAYAVWVAARSDQSSVAAGEMTDWLLARRRILRTLLAGLGALVALSTLALGAAVRMETELVKEGALASSEATPFEYVLIFGGAGSLLVAGVYVPASLGLRRQARVLAGRLFDLPGADEPAVLLERFEQRVKFEQLLGVEAGPFADLQAGIVVLAPLLASAATVWLPR
ncbi:hypothetical protein [Streptomyces canus]|uniref:hypothetical protein n=1 Tax=Streptomyces canus TaxID=58343 RepID=UPI0037FC10A0